MVSYLWVGCAGSCSRSTSDVVLERPSRRHSSRRELRGRSISRRELWAASSDEMDNNPPNSRMESSQPSTPGFRSYSGGGPPSTNGTFANGSNSNAFVNHALILWQERRREWNGNRQSLRPAGPREPVLSWTTTYDDLLATSRPFARPIPLTEMVDFLVDVWEQEGLYDNF